VSKTFRFLFLLDDILQVNFERFYMSEVLFLAFDTAIHIV
jgi:hypothetical protein